MVKVEVKEIAVANDGSYALVLLSTAEGEIVPVSIDLLQARAIMIARTKEKFARPLTHDLLLDIIKILNAKISRIEITDLIEGTYYAKLILENRGLEFEIDARPSDAIALAVKQDIDIFIAKDIVEKNSLVEEEFFPKGAAQA
ncbi:MAG TPA: bifunctional nuclease family protein [Trueperaceae bacterium]|nr:bifunctional nuclease family protein [Trueperaceae bacterium]